MQFSRVLVTRRVRRRGEFMNHESREVAGALGGNGALRPSPRNKYRAVIWWDISPLPPRSVGICAYAAEHTFVLYCSVYSVFSGSVEWQRFGKEVLFPACRPFQFVTCVTARETCAFKNRILPPLERWYEIKRTKLGDLSNQQLR